MIATLFFFDSWIEAYFALKIIIPIVFFIAVFVFIACCAILESRDHKEREQWKRECDKARKARDFDGI